MPVRIQGLIGNINRIIRREANAPNGGRAADVIVVEGDRSPVLSKKKNKRGSMINVVYVGEEWVKDHAIAELELILSTRK